ncbi:MAG: hypothetical protein HC905_00505 [Bacteroidales bacterium]|nr:hypothetical protein [Bacteroidales bacterium]
MLRVSKIVLIFLMVCFTVEAQKKNSVKTNNIKSVTEYKQDVDKNNGAKVKEAFTLYDINGNILEEIEYDSQGKVKVHMKYQFDSNGNKTKEIEIAPDGKIIKTTEYKYNGDIRTEKNIYDGAGKLKSKRTYQYEYQK